MENPPETPLSLSGNVPSTLNSELNTDPEKVNADNGNLDNSPRDIPSQGLNQEAESVVPTQVNSEAPVANSAPVASISVVQQAAISNSDSAAAESSSQGINQDAVPAVSAQATAEEAAENPASVNSLLGD